MDWLFDLYKSNPTAQAIAVIAVVCTVGMLLGSLKVKGIGLGSAAVLFAGIFFGYISRPLDHKTLEFVKEFGLILFVFCIGLQLGPGFFASLRKMGMKLNALAATVVVTGASLAVGLGHALGIESPAVLGVFAGATTNTPSLGAAQQTLGAMPALSPDQASLPALAYAVTYPAAIVGIIGTILFLKRLFKIDPAAEAASFDAEQKKDIEPLERRTIVIDNDALEDVAIAAVAQLNDAGVVISRIKRRGEVEVHAATHDTRLHQGDLVLAVGTARALNRCEPAIGHANGEDLMRAPGAVTYRRIAVTRPSALGKTVHELGIEQMCGVAVTRVTRADLEMTAVPNLRLQFGDVLQVVGNEVGIAQASAELGNSLKSLNQTHFVPLFAGIAAGIALGTLPLAVPGMPQPVRLGLAGGPLVVAIVAGRVGRLGPFIWHMPLNANLAFREFGIALFFAAVGLLAGPQFFASVLSVRGLTWLAAGVCVTVAPILLVGLFARGVLRMNFVAITGLLAGSMTDPPALAFAGSVCGTESPAVAYATVFPLTTMLRILTVQVIAVALCG